MPDIEKISQQVEADRTRLAETLDALSDTAAPHNMADQARSTVTDVSTDLAQKAWGVLREQPAGGVLVTLGLGLLAAGSQRSVPAVSPSVAPHHAAVSPDEAMDGFDARVAAADAELRDEMTGEIDPGPQASHLRARLNAGLDKLPAKARARVIKARKVALQAQERVERQAKLAARQTRGFIHEQPLAAGALALGFGIVAGALLRNTNREDALLGARRDALMAEARSALEDELQKIATEAKSMIGQASPNETSAMPQAGRA